MRKIRFLLLLLGIAAVTTGCPPRGETLAPSQYKPILMSKEQLRKSVAFEHNRTLKNPGKIYYKSGYIFVNERYKGVHVIDNRDPSAPKNIGFIRVPGCLDMAMKDNVLYVDNAVDLVTIDLANPAQPAVASRSNDVFPESTPPDGGILGSEYNESSRPANTVVVDWVKI